MILALFVLYLTSPSSEAMDNVTGSSNIIQSTDKSPDNQKPKEDLLKADFPCSTETYPFMVKIRLFGNNDPKKSVCSGTLISPLHVLTAASCLRPKHTLAVMAGIDRPKGSGEARIVRDQIPHYNYRKIKTNIAILVLEKRIETNAHIQYAVLPARKHYITDIDRLCEDGLSLGWGHTVYEGQDSKSPAKSKLNCAQLAVFTSKRCSTMSRGQKVSEGSICTLSLECQGDQGGPILCNGKQFAVIAWQTGCSNPFIAVHSRVDANLGFIRKFLEPVRSLGTKGVSILAVEVTKWVIMAVFVFI